MSELPHKIVFFVHQIAFSLKAVPWKTLRKIALHLSLCTVLLFDLLFNIALLLPFEPMKRFFRRTREIISQLEATIVSGLEIYWLIPGQIQEFYISIVYTALAGILI